MGPTDWRLSSSDWAGYVTTQWQPASCSWFPPGCAGSGAVAAADGRAQQPGAALTARLPNLGNNWGPRLSLAVGAAESHWPVLRMGYGMYFGRTRNATVESALTHTGSLKGDLSFFMRPTDNLNAGGAPPFPYVLAGEPASVVKPGAQEFAPGFGNPEVHQAVTAVEEALPGRVELTAGRW